MKLDLFRLIMVFIVTMACVQANVGKSRHIKELVGIKSPSYANFPKVERVINTLYECKEYPESCTSDSECCSNYCQSCVDCEENGTPGGFCTHSNKFKHDLPKSDVVDTLYECKEYPESCTSDTECCSNYCESCVDCGEDRTPGGFCTRSYILKPVAFQSEIVDTMYECKEYPESCTSDSECCSNYCQSCIDCGEENGTPGGFCTHSH